jgi:GntR family transcriptional regulator
MMFFVDTGSRLPIYQQLVLQVREGIARGDLEPEDRLASVRQLSSELEVNPNTIARAYTELEREGLLVSRPGLGIFVARQKTEITKAARDRRLADLLDRCLTEAVHLGYSSDEVIQAVTQRAEQFQWKTDGRK